MPQTRRKGGKPGGPLFCPFSGVLFLLLLLLLSCPCPVCVPWAGPVDLEMRARVALAAHAPARLATGYCTQQVI